MLNDMRRGRLSCRRPIGLLALLFVVAAATVAVMPGAGAGQLNEAEVDTALIVSVDVSNSVDAHRYRLQMEGIAQALVDGSVIDTVKNGPKGAILFAMVTWADRPTMSVPWVKITSREDAEAVAARIRKLPHQGGEFTCMSRMMRYLNDKIVPTIPLRAQRVVIDISGDGIDNCNSEDSTDAVRDELVSQNVTINGLPIIETAETPVGAGAYRAPGNDFSHLPPPRNDEPLKLEKWYRDHVIGGPAAFLLRADGYGDFGRAIRQKFVVEISSFAAGTAREAANRR